VTKVNANAVIYESTTVNPSKDLYILLKAGSTAAADIYFF